MTVLLGTSGWSYESWIGDFYPGSYQDKKKQWLEYYGGFFPTVEEARPSFNLPDHKVVDSWIRKTSDLEHFELSLIIPHYISHHLLTAGEMEKMEKALDEFEERVMAPLYLNQRLGMVLLELSPFYKFSKKNLMKLVKALDFLKYLSYNYSVEFQDTSWLNINHDGLRDEVNYNLRERSISPCVVDGENFPFIMDTRSENVYFKLYGRNREAWEDWLLKKSVGSGQLFNYNYSESELRDIADKLEYSEGRTVRVYFKNHPQGQAPENARSLARLLELPPVQGGNWDELRTAKMEEAEEMARHEVQTTFDDFE